MTRELTPIDIRRVPELAQLVDEVRTTRKPRRITRDNEDVAILMPARPRRAKPSTTQAQRDAVRASVGGWDGLVDAEQLKRDLDTARSDDTLPASL